MPETGSDSGRLTALLYLGAGLILAGAFLVALVNMRRRFPTLDDDREVQS